MYFYIFQLTLELASEKEEDVQDGTSVYRGTRVWIRIPRKEEERKTCEAC